MKRMYDENEIKSIASESGGGKLYLHSLKGADNAYIIATTSTPITTYEKFIENINNFISIYIHDNNQYWWNCGVTADQILPGEYMLYVYSPFDNAIKPLLNETTSTMSDTVTEL